MTGRNCRRMIALVIAATLFGGAPASAQQQAQAPAKIDLGPDYSKTRINPLNFYRPLYVAPPVLTNSPRLDQLIKEGQLRLTLEDAITLALENNLDISVQRYTPQISATEVLRTKAGLGTPAGSFDPTLTGTLGWERRTIPINNPFLAGTGTVLQSIINYSAQSNFGLTQGFPTGTAYSITWNNSRSSTSNPSTFLNPSTSSTLVLGFSQPLLNGFGFLPNTRFLKVAKNNKRIADLTFELQLVTTVSQVQNMYWDLVFAREDVKVKQRSVELAEKLYNDNKRQVEIGTLAPIEVVRAEAEVARTRQDLIVAQTFLLQQQTLLKNAITKNPVAAGLAEVEVVPTDAITKPPIPEAMTLDQAVKEAWAKRPDVKQSRIDLENRDITTRASRNALLPSLTLSGAFSGTGLAGNARQTVTTPTGTFRSTGNPVVDTAGNPLLIGGVPAFTGATNTTSTTFLAQGGYSDSLDILRRFAFPTYGVQLSLNIPVMNRSAQAANVRAQLEQKQAEANYQKLQNGIVVEVRNAQIALEQNRARVEAAQKSRELAERTLDAEQKKYQLGASTIFFVIQAQRDLAAAQSTEVSALVALTKAKVEFERSLGRTLEVNRISVAGAEKGERNKLPLIPGTPAAELIGARVKF